MATHIEEIDIAAPATRVWETWMDLERWPEWAPAIKGLTKITPGPVAVGTKATVEAARSPRSTWEVTALEEPRSFTWATSVRGIGIVAGHRAEERDGLCHVTLSVEYGGLLSLLFRPMLMRVARRNVRDEAEGLKRRCEAVATSKA